MSPQGATASPRFFDGWVIVLLRGVRAATRRFRPATDRLDVVALHRTVEDHPQSREQDVHDDGQKETHSGACLYASCERNWNIARRDSGVKENIPRPG